MNSTKTYRPGRKRLLRKKSLALITSGLLLSLIAVEANAVSTAAVLYLRIAAGARPSGMGQAYIAVADDATASHWNPAGLGAPPLTATWRTVTIPEKYQPIQTFVSYRGPASSSGLSGYEVWALTPLGLVRYDGSKWLEHIEYFAESDETVESIVRKYTQVKDDEKLAALMSKVADYNGQKSRDYIDELETRILSALPEGNKENERIKNSFVTLRKAYNQILVNWNAVDKLEDRFADAMKDKNLSQKEIDRISVALEKSVLHYTPEKIHLPLNILFSGELTSLEADGRLAWVGTTDGLFRFDGRGWVEYRKSKPVAEGEEVIPSLPSNNIICMEITDSRLYVGTDQGMAAYFGISWNEFGIDDGLPTGRVSAISIVTQTEGWAVVDNDIYKLKDGKWKNYTDYTVGIDETPEVIADNFAIYGTDLEKKKYLAKLKELNTPLIMDVEGPTGPDIPDASFYEPNVDTNAEENSPAKSAISAHELAGGTGEDSSVEETTDLATTENEGSGEESGESAPTAEPKKDSEPAFGFSLGDVIKAPIVADIKGDVTTIYSDGKTLWVGTEQGLLSYDGKKWKRYGYKPYTARASMTVTEIALELTKGDSASALAVADGIRRQNDLYAENGFPSDRVEEGATVWVYRNIAGSRINDIGEVNGKVFIASEGGALKFDGENLSRFNESGLGNSSVVGVSDADDRLWFSTDKQVKYLREPKANATLMYTKWLPELADDLGYFYGSYAQQIGGAGTFSASISYFSYGSITRTGETSADPIGEETPYDVALSLSYGFPISEKTSLGFGVKGLISHLASQGAGAETGSGDATGFALDFGLLHRFSDRLAFGAALTNLGPKVSYIDAQQADNLPINLGLGMSWKPIKTELLQFMTIADVNQILVENKLELIVSGGGELSYADLVAFRAGYHSDNAGDLHYLTFGIGLTLKSQRVDFAYIPSSDGVALANTLITSASFTF
ncbi:MAG: PorV/PorQ family protein [candidate division Zixibacteria bacterium]|nr:PorV/PorQ family protein [candidate division Zixibacteria bacterium]